MSLIQHIYQEKDHKDCSYNRDIFRKLREELPDLKVEEFDAKSSRGQELTKQYDVLNYPATIVNGKFYTRGGVKEEELLKLLKEN